MNQFTRILAAVAFGLVLPGTVRAEPVVFERDSTLRAEPSLTGQSIGQARPGTRGEILARRTPWIQVKTAETTGWVFMFNVRYGERQADPAGGIGRVGRPQGVVSTIGIRGLSEEELNRAAFNGAELQRMESFAASRDDSEREARGKSLAPVRVDLPEGGTR